jgi:hypothetical protein
MRDRSRRACDEGADGLLLGKTRGPPGARRNPTGGDGCRKLIVGGAVALACLGLGFVDGAVNHAFALRDLILGGVGIGSAPTLYENVSFKGAGFEANVVSARETSDVIDTATEAATATPVVRGDAGERPKLPPVDDDTLKPRSLTTGDSQDVHPALLSGDPEDDAESAAVRDEANPIAQFAVLRVAIERELLALAQLAGVASQRPRPPSWWVNRLRELHIFEPALAEALFRVIRVANRAIHGQVDSDAAPIIATSGPELLRSIQGLRFNPAYLGRIISARGTGGCEHGSQYIVFVH